MDIGGEPLQQKQRPFRRYPPMGLIVRRVLSRSSAKIGSSSSSSSKDGDRDQEGVSNQQLEILDHLSQDPSTWSREILQAITLTHASTVHSMS